MGGKEGSRGYIYQGLAAAFEALTQSGWDRICVEFQTDDEKVDIALESDGDVKTAIQVKSTINSFSKDSLIKWLKAMRSDYGGVLFRRMALSSEFFTEPISY